MILAAGGALLFAASMGFAFEFDRRRKRREALERFPASLVAMQASAAEFSRVIGETLRPAFEKASLAIVAASKTLRLATMREQPTWDDLARPIGNVE